MQLERMSTKSEFTRLNWNMKAKLKYYTHMTREGNNMSPITLQSKKLKERESGRKEKKLRYDKYISGR